MHCTPLKAHAHGSAILVLKSSILIPLKFKSNSQYQGTEWLKILNSCITQEYSTFVLSFKVTAGSFMLFPQNDLQLHFHLAHLMTITEFEIQQHFFVVQVDDTLKCFEYVRKLL